MHGTLSQAGTQRIVDDKQLQLYSPFFTRVILTTCVKNKMTLSLIVIEKRALNLLQNNA
jgi:hypothetical protein